MAGTPTAEIAAAAARLVVEEGMEYGAGQAARARDLGAPRRCAGRAARQRRRSKTRCATYLDLFYADTQPAELAALRASRAVWMERLARLPASPDRRRLARHRRRGCSSICIDLFCDDSKSAELALIDMRRRLRRRQHSRGRAAASGRRAERCQPPSRELGEPRHRAR